MLFYISKHDHSATPQQKPNHHMLEQYRKYLLKNIADSPKQQQIFLEPHYYYYQQVFDPKDIRLKRNTWYLIARPMMYRGWYFPFIHYGLYKDGEIYHVSGPGHLKMYDLFIRDRDPKAPKNTIYALLEIQADYQQLIQNNIDSELNRVRQAKNGIYDPYYSTGYQFRDKNCETTIKRILYSGQDFIRQNSYVITDFFKTLFSLIITVLIILIILTATLYLIYN